MAYLSQITVGNITYDLRDRTISGAMHFVGSTTSDLYDGATTKPVIVNGESYIQDTGDVVLYDGTEFVWDGSKWVLLGDESSYAVHGTYESSNATQSGTISKPNVNLSLATGKFLTGINQSASSYGYAASVEGETLKIKRVVLDVGAVTSFDNDAVVKSGSTAELESAPEFTGNPHSHSVTI